MKLAILAEKIKCLILFVLEKCFYNIIKARQVFDTSLMHKMPNALESFSSTSVIYFTIIIKYNFELRTLGSTVMMGLHIFADCFHIETEIFQSF